MNKNVKQPVMPGKIAKVPMVMQMEALECGAAALDMVLGYYGRFVPLSQVRKECGVSRDGSNLKYMGLTAINYGLDVKIFRYNTGDLKTKASCPCILFWEKNHFVVLRGYKRGCFYINDPGTGIVRIPEDRFKESYSNVCMMFEPKEEFQPGGEPDSVWNFAKKNLHGTGTVAAYILVTTFLLVLIGLLEPVFPRFFVDNLMTPQASGKWAAVFFIAYFVIVAAKFAVKWFNAVYLLQMQGKMSLVANTGFMWHLLRMPMEFFSQRYTADILDRQKMNSKITVTLVTKYIPLVLDIVAMILFLLLMIQYSVWMALIGVAAVLFNVWISKVVSQKRINLSRLQMKNAALLSNSEMAGISMIETIKSAGCEDGYFEYWAGLQAENIDNQVQTERVDRYYGQLPNLVTTITSSLILCIGVAMIIKSDWTIGLVTAFIGYFSSFSAPVNKILECARSFQKMRTSMERISDVMDYPAELPQDIEYDDPERTYHKLSGQVEFKNVTFGYNRLIDPLIKDFSLKIEPGQSIAFVGSSGSGKSTLAKLLVGLYQPWEGQILFDGKAVSEILHSEFTASVAMVDQEISLFADSVKNNITMRDRTISDETVTASAKDARIYNEIIIRDNGFETEMSECGQDYSGGERQRIEIARALASEPCILVMDEATSALDAETENTIMTSIRKREITTIMISHRLSTVRDCDMIIVLKDGREIARGKHEELMETCEYYAEMITNQ